jgi:hypothetical protein
MLCYKDVADRRFSQIFSFYRRFFRKPVVSCRSARRKNDYPAGKSDRQYPLEEKQSKPILPQTGVAPFW